MRGATLGKPIKKIFLPLLLRNEGGEGRGEEVPRAQGTPFYLATVFLRMLETLITPRGFTHRQRLQFSTICFTPKGFPTIAQGRGGMRGATLGKPSPTTLSSFLFFGGAADGLVTFGTRKIIGKRTHRTFAPRRRKTKRTIQLTQTTECGRPRPQSRPGGMNNSAARKFSRAKSGKHLCGSIVLAKRLECARLAGAFG